LQKNKRNNKLEPEGSENVYQWINGNSYTCQVTFYPTNITLNAAACTFFQDIRWVRIGLDLERKRVAIEPVPKATIELGVIPREQLQKLSLGKGDGRISNKAIMHEIYTSMHVPVDGCKYAAAFNQNENLLEIECGDGMGKEG